MTTLKQGDLIHHDGYTRKVLGACGEVVHISTAYNHNEFSFTSTESKLKEYDYTWDAPAWLPEIGDTYYFVYIDTGGSIRQSTWNSTYADHARRDFLGIHQTEELCEAALLEIRRKLGK